MQGQDIMKITIFFLRSGAVFLLLLFSIGAYAIPMVDSNISLVQGERGGHPGPSSISGVVSKTDERIMLLLVSLHSGRQNTENSDMELLSISNSPEGFALLFNLSSASGSPWPDWDLTSFPAFRFLQDDAADLDQPFRLGNDENGLIDFLAMLGIVTAGWEPSNQHPQGIDDAPPVEVAGVVRRGPRDGCVRAHNEQSNKHGWRDSLCPESGFAGTGSSGTRMGKSGMATGGGGGGSGSGHIGTGNPGGGGGGGSPGGNSNPGGSGGGSSGGGGGSGSAGGGPGGGNGGGAPGSGSSGGAGGGTEDPVPPSEVGTVPEPGTLALVGLGLAGMYIARYRKRVREAFPASPVNQRLPRGAGISN
jgi:hypothetical protein